MPTPLKGKVILFPLSFTAWVCCGLLKFNWFPGNNVLVAVVVQSFFALCLSWVQGASGGPAGVGGVPVQVSRAQGCVTCLLMEGAKGAGPGGGVYAAVVVSVVGAAVVMVVAVV